MIEVETKYRIPNEGVADVLNIIEGKCHLEVHSQSDIIYLNGASSFVNFVPGTPVVRIRDSDQCVVLTVKRKRPDGGMWEVEVPLTAPSTDLAVEMMDCLGWTLVTRVDKLRRSGVIRDLNVAIDNVLKLGTFVEIEALVGADEEVAAVESKIDALREELGIDARWREDRKYDELMVLAQ